MNVKRQEHGSPELVLTAAVIFSALPFLLIEIFPSHLNVVIDRAPYLVFHNIAEFFSIMVSLSIFGVGWFAYKQSRDERALFLSAAFLAIGLMDFMHAMSNAAMPDFITPNSSNKSTQFWIAARLFQALAFVVSAFVYPSTPGGRSSKVKFMASALLVTGFVFAGITFFPTYVPDTFVAGVGLTPFKKNSEYLVILLTLAAAIAYWRRMERTGDRLLVYYIAAFIISIFGEIAFAVYTRVFDTYNALGHVYKVASFTLLYAGLFASSVKKPYVELSEASEEIRKLNIELEEKVIERTSELVRSEGKYRNLFSTMTEGFGLHEIVLNAEGKPCDYRFLEVNDAFERLTGLSRQKVLGRTIRQVIPDIEPYWIETYGRVALTGEPAHFENYSSPLGRWYGTYSYSPAKNQFAVLFGDISERKRAEELLLASEQRLEKENREIGLANRILRIFVEETGDALYDKALEIVMEGMGSRHGVFGYIDERGHLICPSMSRLLDECEVEGKCIHYPPEKWKGLWARALLEKRTLRKNEASWVPPGHPAIRNNMAVPILFQGRVIGLFNLANKETGYTEEDREMIETIAGRVAPVLYAWVQRELRENERRRVEEEIVRLNAELNNKVSELDAVNRQLESFIYSISHDLRAPLRAMSGFAKMLVEDCADALDNTGNDYLERIQKGAGKMTRLIDDLLHLSRISKQEFNPSKVDLSGIALSVVTDLLEADPGRRVETNIAEGLCAVADMRMMEIVFSNLIGNSWKFTSKTGKPCIEFGALENPPAHPSREGTIYYIKDNGAGFDPNYKDKMFGPFQRLHSDSEFEGTGIGLTIVERIIQRHGGRVWAEGEPGKGATVYFTLA